MTDLHITNFGSGNIQTPSDRAAKYADNIRRTLQGEKELAMKNRELAMLEDQNALKNEQMRIANKTLKDKQAKDNNRLSAITEAEALSPVAKTIHMKESKAFDDITNSAYESLANAYNKGLISDENYDKELSKLNSQLRTTFGGMSYVPEENSKKWLDKNSEWNKALDRQSQGYVGESTVLDSKTTRKEIFDKLLPVYGYDKSSTIADDIMRKRFGGLTPEQIKNSKDEVTKIFDKKMALLGSSSDRGNGKGGSSSTFNGRVTTTDTNSYKLLKESIEDLGLEKHKTHADKIVDNVLDYKPSQDDIWNLVKAVKLTDPTISDSQIAETLPVIINKNGWFRDSYFKNGMSKSEVLPVFMSLINKNSHNTVKKVGYDITGDDGTVHTVSKADLGNIYTKEYLKDLAAINKNSRMHMDGEKSTIYNSNAADFFKNYKVPPKKDREKKIPETTDTDSGDAQQSIDYGLTDVAVPKVDPTKDRVTNIQGNNKYDIIDQARELYNNGDITSDEYYKAVKSVSNHYDNYDNDKISSSDGITTELPLVNRNLNNDNKVKALNYRQAYLNYLLGKGSKPVPPEFITQSSKTDRSIGINMLPPKGSKVVLDGMPDESGTKPSIGDLNKQFDSIRGLLNSQGSN